MEGARAKPSSKKQRPAVEESSGEDGALQIDVGKKGGGKKPGEGGKGSKAEEGWRVGDLVWAKVSGYVHWPAKVFDPANPLIPEYLREPPKPNYCLVRFLGTYDMQWASSRQIESYEKGQKKRLHTKSRSKLFAKALSEAKQFLDTGELPKGMDEKPPVPDEEEEEENVDEESAKLPVKVGTKRKTTAKSGGGRQRKVKVVSDTEEESDAAPAKEKEEKAEEKGSKDNQMT